MPTDAAACAAPAQPMPVRRAAPPRALSELDRHRIAFLRLALVLALVFLHYGGVYASPFSPYRGFQGQPLPVASILISFVLYVGFTAVPAMSAISGFLFFQGASAERAPDFARKMRRRVRSLGIPFLIWGTGFALIAYAAHLANPALFAVFFSPEQSFLRTWGDAILGINRTQVAFQLWFVRDLMLTVAVSPLIWLLMGRLPWLTLAALVPLWILDWQLVIFHRLDVLLFFCFGAACAMHGLRPELPRRWILPVFVLFLAAAMARTLAPWLVGRSAGLDFDIATGAMRILGALAVWNAAALVLDTRLASWAQRNSYLAFFVHCAHYPPILFLKLGLGRLIDPASETAQIALYLVTVSLTITGLVAAGRLLQRKAPRLFAVISGGRTEAGERAERPGFLPTPQAGATR